MRIITLIVLLFTLPAYAVNFPVGEDARFVVYDTTLPGCVLNDPLCLVQKGNRNLRVEWPSTDRNNFPPDWPPNISYLEILRPANPAFDPLLEKITRAWVLDRIAGEYRHEPTVTALTQQEIDDITASQERVANQQDCRTRPTPGIRIDRQDIRAGQGNASQRLGLLEEYVARMMGCIWPHRVGPVTP